MRDYALIIGAWVEIARKSAMILYFRAAIAVLERTLPIAAWLGQRNSRIRRFAYLAYKTIQSRPK